MRPQALRASAFSRWQLPPIADFTEVLEKHPKSTRLLERYSSPLRRRCQRCAPKSILRNAPPGAISRRRFRCSSGQAKAIHLVLVMNYQRRCLGAGADHGVPFALI